MDKKKIALVMGSGAARGLSHIGVLKVLEKNKWRRFPYYYTLLALNDIHENGFSTKSVIAEMRYASSGLERLLKRKPKNEKYDIRRRTLAQRVLEKC